MSDLSDRFRGRRAMVFLDYRNIVSAIDPDISILTSTGDCLSKF